jgi:site-specific DNA-methyltransferase (adenine-specific)
MTYEVLHGDCRALMADMEGCSVDSVVTDPPYELGFMGREWDSTGVAYDVATWAEALRVLKPGGWLVAFGGSRTYHRMACAIEDAGFEIRDQIMWIYGSGFPKGGNRDGKGTCLKPAHEPIVLARKPLIGSVARNEAAFGTGALSIDACRVNPGEMTKTGGRSRRGNVYADYEADGPFVAHDRGRWPANVLHDGSDDVVAGFPITESRDGVDKGIKAQVNVYGAWRSERVGKSPQRRDAGTAARFFYCAKASKSDRDEGLSAFAPQAFVQFQTGNGESGKASSLSDGRETQYRNTHPTVKPEALMRWLVRLITPPGGLVLDPFTGSGSTGKAAVLEGFDFVGCELTPEYLPIANARIAAAVVRAEQAQAAAPQYDMFDGAAA